MGDFLFIRTVLLALKFLPFVMLFRFSRQLNFYPSNAKYKLPSAHKNNLKVRHQYICIFWRGIIIVCKKSKEDFQNKGMAVFNKLSKSKLLCVCKSVRLVEYIVNICR